uniref:Metal transporter n=1 Tax=Leersia perrieri TaxID=77586 RepID=A0A0D9V1C6_9ORYZ
MEEERRIEKEHEQQQHGRGSGRVAAVGGSGGGGGGREEIEVEVAAAAEASSSGQHGGRVDDGVQVPKWKRFLAHVGPGFVISIAYLDPSNSNLGIITGRHLAELCKGEYPKYVKYCLWLLAELGVIAATIPGVLGTALAYNMLLHIPFWGGVLACGACTTLILGLQAYGARKMEFTISALMLVMATCFFIELGKVKPPVGGAQSLPTFFFGANQKNIIHLQRTQEYSGKIKFNCVWFGSVSVWTKLHSGYKLFWPIHYAGLLWNEKIVLSFVLPFALIPLIKFSSSCTIVGPYKNSTSIIRIAWILSLVIIGINIYFFCTSFVDWLVHSDLPRVVNAIISTLVFPFMAAYIAALIYLAFRKVNISASFPTSSVSCDIEVQHIHIQEKSEDLGVNL